MTPPGRGVVVGQLDRYGGTPGVAFKAKMTLGRGGRVLRWEAECPKVFRQHNIWKLSSFQQESPGHSVRSLPLPPAVRQHLFPL